MNSKLNSLEQLVKVKDRKYLNVVFSETEYCLITTHFHGISIRYHKGEHNLVINHHVDSDRVKVIQHGITDTEGVIEKLIKRVELINLEKCPVYQKLDKSLRKLIMNNNLKVFQHDAPVTRISSKDQQYTFFINKRNFIIWDTNKQYLIGGFIQRDKIVIEDRKDNLIHLMERVLKSFLKG